MIEMLELMEISHLRKSHPLRSFGWRTAETGTGEGAASCAEVVLLDEATKGLDPFFKLTLAGILKKTYR